MKGYVSVCVGGGGAAAGHIPRPMAHSQVQGTRTGAHKGAVAMDALDIHDQSAAKGKSDRHQLQGAWAATVGWGNLTANDHES